MDSFRPAVEKGAGFISGIFEAYRLLINSFITTLLDERKSIRSIVSMVSSQIYFTGVQSLPITIFLASVVGVVLMIQVKLQMTLLGVTDLPGIVFVTVVFRELSVILPAIVLVARSGSAIASELASMRVNREVDALEVMGISPLSFIIFPRIIGGIFSLIGLTIYFNFIALMSGFVSVSVFMGMDFHHFLSNILDQIVLLDIFVLFIKILISALIIFTVCSVKGLSVKSSSHEVPQATMSAVMSSLVYVLSFHFVCTSMFYLLKYYGVI